MPVPVEHHLSRVVRAAALLALGAATGFSQASSPGYNYNVREWHADDGLPSEDVTQLLQDRKGFLWVATRSGLARFDGTEFVPVQDPQGASPFIAINETPDGTLLCIPRTGDPLAFRAGRFTPQPLPGIHAGKAVGAALSSTDGKQWYSVAGAVLRVRKDGVDVFDQRDGISVEGWTRFATDENQRVWMVGNSFIGREKSGGLEQLATRAVSGELRIASSRNGGPWIITSDHVLKFDRNDQLQEIALVPALLGAHYVTTACEDKNGALWLGTRSQGLHRVTVKGQEHVPTSHDDIYTLVQDRDGTLWAGMNSGGLNAITPKTFRLYNKATGLLETATFSLCEDEAGDMWFGNGDGGLARLHRGELSHEVTRYNGAIFGVVSVSPAGDGVWLTGAPGLFRARANPLRIEYVDTVPSTGIRRVTRTMRNGDLWLSVDRDHIGRVRDGALQTFGPDEGFHGRDVRAIKEDSAGNLWVGTSDGRLFVYDGTFKRVNLPITRPTGGISAIHFSETDSVWLGTASSGIVVLKGGHAVIIGPEQGLPFENISQIVADEHGDLWCGSPGGVFRLQHEEAQHFIDGKISRVAVFRLGKDEGLNAATCLGIYGPASTRSRDGQIWFATRQGVLAINPSAEVLTPRPPVVTIEEAKFDGVPRPLEKPLLVRGDIRKLEIHFSVLNLSAPSRAQTRYRLEGFDADWVFAGATHTAVYPRLPPGEYRFSVRTSFSMSNGSGTMDTLVISVPPLWWQRLWVQLAALVLLITGIAWLVRGWSHRRLRLRLEKLERESAIARERARIAQNIHDDVGASLTRISLLTQAVKPESMPQASNLGRIHETAREITRSLDEIVWAVNPQYDSLESFADYLTSFAQNFLGVAGIRCRLQIPPNLAPLPLTSQTRYDLFLCCREALNNVVKHARATEVVLSMNHDPKRLILRIADNGHVLRDVGPELDRSSSGHGQKNMRERMTSIGGTCRIEADPAGGTVVALELEINPAHAPTP